MKKAIKPLLFGTILALAGTSGAYADPYKIIIPTPDEDLQGAMVFLVNYDTGAKMDSVLVDGPETIFKGEIDEPVLARLLIDGQRAGTFIIENGSGIFDPNRREIKGMPLNDRMNEFGVEVEKLSARLTPATSPEESAAIFEEYENLVKKTLDENADNPIGYYLFIQEASQLSGDDFKMLLDQYPHLAKYDRVAKLKSMMSAREATQPGGKYVDFAIEQPDGTTARLSDYVKPGRYTLVDFWASWCGPCIRQVAVLKDIYKEFGSGKGPLDVVGVAVWDKPEDTQRAIISHGLPWPSIINAGSVPTDLYGISGIPCIILIGPDGTILSRDKQDEELRNDVRNAINK